MGNKSVLPLLVVSISLVAVVRTIGSVGLTWDEANFIPSSNRYMQWYGLLTDSIKRGDPASALSRDTITYHWFSTSEHPPFAKLLSGITMYAFAPFTGIIFASRISTAIIFSLLLLTVYKLTGDASGHRCGLFSALSLLIMPRIFGHAHLATLDIPMVFTWTLTVFSFTRGIEKKKWSIIAGISFGLALSTKLNSLFLPVPLILWAQAYHRKKYLRNILAMATIAPAIFFLMWPWLWPEPIARTLGYLKTAFGRMTIPVGYFGTTYSETNAPWHYPVVLTVITLPPMVALLALTTLTRRVKHSMLYCISRKAKKKLNDSNTSLFLFNILTCIMLVSLPQVNKYDGVRLFLPAFPFIACLSGIELERLLKRVNFLRNKYIVSTGVLIIALSAIPLARIHPYYLSYYNIFVGGVKTAAKAGFESTYWGDTCTDDVLRYLNRNAPGEAKVVFYPFGSNVVAFYKFTGRLREDILHSGLEELDEAHYLVLNCRQGFFDRKLWNIYKNTRPEFATEFDGVLLTAIYRVN